MLCYSQAGSGAINLRQQRIYIWNNRVICPKRVCRLLLLLWIRRCLSLNKNPCVKIDKWCNLAESSMCDSARECICERAARAGRNLVYFSVDVVYKIQREKNGNDMCSIQNDSTTRCYVHFKNVFSMSNIDSENSNCLQHLSISRKHTMYSNEFERKHI